MFFTIPWYIPKTETIKLKSCRSLIEHYCGNFLEKLALEQLSVNLYNGTGTVSNVTLDCEALNKLGDEQQWPLNIMKGHVQDITIKVPWSNVFKDESVLKVDGLSLILQPKVRVEPAKSFLKWLILNWPKLSSKRLFTFKRNPDEIKESHKDQGEEMFADSIEVILKRLKLRLENTQIRVEHLPKHINKGFALDIFIRSVECYDVVSAGYIPLVTEPARSKTYLLNNYLKKKITVEGIQLYTDEFYINRYTSRMQKLKDSLPEMHRFFINCKMDKRRTDYIYQKMNIDKPAGEVNTLDNVNFMQREENSEGDRLTRLGPLLFAIFNEQQETTLSLNELGLTERILAGAETIGPFTFTLSPKQLDVVIDILKCLKKTPSNQTRRRASGLDFTDDILCCLD